MSKSALVVGATGAIGSRVHDYLHLDGWNVLATTRRTPQTKQELDWNTVFSGRSSTLRNVDLIINCASPNKAWASVNPRGFAEWMRAHGRQLSELRDFCSASLAFSISTVQVYGEYQIGTVDEMSPLEGQHPYAQGHSALESILFEANWNLLRLSNTFGTAGKAGKLDMSGVTNDLAFQIARTGDAELREGKQTRDFLPIKSMLTMLREMILKPCRPSIVNVCSGRMVSLERWKELIIAVHREGLSGESAYPDSNELGGHRYSSTFARIGDDELMHDTKFEITRLLEYFATSPGRGQFGAKG